MGGRGVGLGWAGLGVRGCVGGVVWCGVGWGGGLGGRSVLGTIDLGPRPHALGFAKKNECLLKKPLVFAMKNTIFRQGETPMDPP